MRKITSVSIKAYTLLECLLALIIASYIFLAVNSVFTIVMNLSADTQFSQDLLSLQQFRLILACAEDLDIKEDEITYRYDDNNWEVYVVNRHLIVTPGTQIVLEDIDFCEFVNEGNNYYVVYGRNKEIRKVFLY